MRRCVTGARQGVKRATSDPRHRRTHTRSFAARTRLRTPPWLQYCTLTVVAALQAGLAADCGACAAVRRYLWSACQAHLVFSHKCGFQASRRTCPDALGGDVGCVWICCSVAHAQRVQVGAGLRITGGKRPCVLGACGSVRVLWARCVSDVNRCEAVKAPAWPRQVRLTCTRCTQP